VKGHRGDLSGKHSRDGAFGEVAFFTKSSKKKVPGNSSLDPNRLRLSYLRFLESGRTNASSMSLSLAMGYSERSRYVCRFAKPPIRPGQPT